MQYLTRRGLLFKKKPASQSQVAETASAQDDESFAFTSKDDEGCSVGENKAGLRSRCSSYRRH